MLIVNGECYRDIIRNCMVWIEWYKFGQYVVLTGWCHIINEVIALLYLKFSNYIISQRGDVN